MEIPETNRSRTKAVGEAIAIREATTADALAVRRILDGAWLEYEGLEDRLDCGNVLLAVDRSTVGVGQEDTEDFGCEERSDPPSTDERILGAIVLEPGVFSEAEPGKSGRDSKSGKAGRESKPGKPEQDSKSGKAGRDQDPDGSPEQETAVIAVAVRQRRRNRGIGRSLIEAALQRENSLVARFDADVHPFYEALGFEIGPADETNRYVGRLRAGSR